MTGAKKMRRIKILPHFFSSQPMNASVILYSQKRYD